MNELSRLEDLPADYRGAIGAFQVLVAVICFLIVAIDGFDTATIGFLAPAIRASGTSRRCSWRPCSEPGSSG